MVARNLNKLAYATILWRVNWRTKPPSLVALRYIQFGETRGWGRGYNRYRDYCGYGRFRGGPGGWGQYPAYGSGDPYPYAELRGNA